MNISVVYDIVVWVTFSLVFLAGMTCSVLAALDWAVDKLPPTEDADA